MSRLKCKTEARTQLKIIYEKDECSKGVDSRKSRLIADSALDVVKIDVCCEMVSSRHDREVAFMKSQQQSWLNKTSIMIPIGMPT